VLSQVAELQQMPPLHEQLLDGFLAGLHQTMTAVEPLRVMAGAGANTRDSPACVTDYQPTEADVGGWFDDSSRAKRIYGSHAKPPQQQQQPQRVQFQVQQLQEPLQQQQQQGLRGEGSASSLAAAVAAAEQEARMQSDAAAAAAGSGRGRRWLRRQRST
jgi:digalactosyldiacylglycerol synthase